MEFGGEESTMEFNFAPYADIGLGDGDYVTTVEVAHEPSIGELTKTIISVPNYADSSYHVLSIDKPDVKQATIVTERSMAEML